MDKEQYDKFVSLSYKEQVDLIYSGLSPKDMDVAEQALKNVPNGDISSGNDTKDSKANTATGEGSGKANSTKPGANKS